MQQAGKYMFQDDQYIFKQGYLKKKSDSLFVGWQERYFILYNDKILYKCKKYDQAYKGCIKLKHHKCQLIVRPRPA